LGIEGELTVKSSLLFGPAFYSALVAGKSIQAAFDYGKSMVTLARRPDANTIVLHVRDGIDPTKSLFEAKAPTAKPNLNSTLERVIRGGGSESDWKTLQRAIEADELVLSQRQVADWDDQAENLTIRFTESAGVVRANLSPETYRRVIESYVLPDSDPRHLHPSLSGGRMHFNT
jgi:hypothetical protein